MTENLEDPRRSFAESLLRDVPPTGTVVVYNKTFEATRLKELAAAFPDLADRLLAIEPRMHDLLRTVESYCYHRDFHGSYSLKSVLPILVPELSYEELDIGEGTGAMEAYATILDPTTDDEKRETLRESLRHYCALDTLAMVEIYRELCS